MPGSLRGRRPRRSRSVPAPSLLRFHCLAEAALQLVDVAPGPGSPGHHRAHDRVPRFVKVPRRVLAVGRIATADVAARTALAQLHPTGALAEAFLACAGGAWCREVSICHPFQVFAQLTHGCLLSAQSAIERSGGLSLAIAAVPSTRSESINHAAGLPRTRRHSC